MKTILFFFLFIILISCNSQENAPITDNTVNIQASISQLNDFLKKYEAPSQIFKIPANKPSKVKGKQGTIISVNPADLVAENGQPIGNNIELELKELTNQEQLLRANAPTVSNGQLLVSGGAYYINLTSEGQQLKLKEGKSLSVEFPQIANEEMALFYGQRDSLGQMNWLPTEQKLRTITVKEPVTNSGMGRDTTFTYLYSEEDDFSQIFAYIEDSTLMSPEDKKKISEIKKKNEERKKNYEKTQKVYQAIGLEKLGWINCDRFLSFSNKTNLQCTVSEKDSIDFIQAYLMFKDINSVMKGGFIKGQNCNFPNIPIGAKTRLISIAIKNGQIVTHQSDLTITEDQNLVLNFTKTTEEQASKLFSLK